MEFFGRQSKNSTGYMVYGSLKQYDSVCVMFSVAVPFQEG